MLLVVFGSSEPKKPPDLPIPVRFMGKFADDPSLVSLYSAADILVAPSREENLANTIMEGMACGTLAVAFDIGGNRDLIDHLETGFLATAFNARELADGMAWLLEDVTRLGLVSQAARRKCERMFDLDSVSRQYERIYQSALSRAVGRLGGKQ
jgi:glycosyltransferase involved in cell wall biosynthesis